MKTNKHEDKKHKHTNKKIKKHKHEDKKHKHTRKTYKSITEKVILRGSARGQNCMGKKLSKILYCANANFLHFLYCLHCSVACHISTI